MAVKSCRTYPKNATVDAAMIVPTMIPATTATSLFVVAPLLCRVRPASIAETAPMNRTTHAKTWKTPATMRAPVKSA